MWNQRLDVSFAMKTLLAPENQNIELTRVTDDQRNAREMKAVTEAALKTPEGKARLALLAGIGQISGWPSSMPEPPAAEDYETRLKTIADSVAGMLNLRTGVEKPAGGSLNWNTDVDYRRLFDAADAETRAMAVEFYQRAGLDMQKDFAALAAAPRIQADAASVAWARHNGNASGKLTRPTLALFTAVDPRASLSEFRAYEQTVRDAGSAQATATGRRVSLRSLCVHHRRARHGNHADGRDHPHGQVAGHHACRVECAREGTGYSPRRRDRRSEIRGLSRHAEISAAVQRGNAFARGGAAIRKTHDSTSGERHFKGLYVYRWPASEASCIAPPFTMLATTPAFMSSSSSD